MIVNGIGPNKNRVFIDFYQDYSASSEVIRNAKQFPFTDVKSRDNFMVDLKDKANHRVLSMSLIADHLLSISTRKSTI